MSLSKSSIAIVGGGIGGVATAIALRQRGIDAVVYEKAPAIRETGVGMMLWPNATRVLRSLGVLEELISSSGSSNSFLVRAQDGRILMDIPLGQFDVPPLCARRADVLNALLAKLPGDAIRLGHRFSRLEQRPDSVHVHFANGATAEHAAVIGADGIRSQVRAQIWGAIEPVARGYTIWRGIAPGRIEANSETWGRGHRVGLLNTGSNRVTWYATSNREEPDLKRTFRDWHHPIPDLIRGSEVLLRHEALDLPVLTHWSRGRVTLLGDAAHPCTPNLGQGCCMAIEDATVITKCIAKEASIAEAFGRYETLRRPRTSHIQQRSRWMGTIGQWENGLLVAGRRIVTSLLPVAPFEYNLRRTYSYEA